MDFKGPCEIDCKHKCAVPPNVTLSEVLRPRHQWADVLCCPQEGCERAFLILPDPTT